MAKRKSTTKRPPPPKKATSVRKTHTINSKGNKVEYLPVAKDYLEDVLNNIEANMREAGDPLDPPTYTFEVFGEGEKTEIYDEESIKEAPEEDQIAWAEHQNAMERLAQRQGTAQLKILVIEGIKNQVPGEWIAKQAYIGNPLPDDPNEQKLQYAKSELIIDTDDIKNLSTYPFLLTYKGVTDEEYAELEASFLGQVDIILASAREKFRRNQNGTGQNQG